MLIDFKLLLLLLLLKLFEKLFEKLLFSFEKFKKLFDFFFV
jgi:hypothetical protein